MKRLVTLATAVCALACALASAQASPPPARLSETGLFEPGALEFSPQFPLWSDGAKKRRWIRLPAGTSIDGNDPDAWNFPPGTKLWKEFSFGRPVETRLVERLPDGSWRYATYVWNDEGTDARLAPEAGVRAMPVAGAPGGRYTVPSRADCLACHEGAPVPVLGFSAVQLARDLRALDERGVVVRLPRALVENPPRIAAPALGYLHGNCGHCHNEAGAVAGIDLVLAQRAADPAASARRTMESLFGRASRFRVPGTAAGSRENVVAHRMQSTNPYQRMPPLGVAVADQEGIALVLQWIQQTTKETPQ
ncbi:MAG: hypothetical protein U1F54_06060 [Burkholderiales bacterium]